MQSADTEGEVRLFEALIIIRKVEAWVLEEAGMVSWKFKFAEDQSQHIMLGWKTGERCVVVACKGRQKMEEKVDS